MVQNSGWFGLVLAGGRSSRFGSPKAEARLGGATLAGRIAALLGSECAIVAASGSAAGLDPGALVLADPPDAAAGPLAGVLAGLVWAGASDAEWLATAPCDTPLLTKGFVGSLVHAAEQQNRQVAVTCSDDGMHPLIAVWRPALADDLRIALSAGHPPVHDYVASMNAAEVHFPAKQILNINTPEDLEHARREIQAPDAES